jgi:uncharacterized protein (DUF1330 family)
MGRISPMKANRKLAIALVASIAAGGAIIQGLHAQAKPPVYVVVDIADITDTEGFKAIIPLSAPDTLTPFGGRYVIRTDKITALDGTPPKRFVVIAFDNVEQAQAWKASESAKKVDVIRDKTTKSSQFLVDGM